MLVIFINHSSCDCTLYVSLFRPYGAVSLPQQRRCNVVYGLTPLLRAAVASRSDGQKLTMKKLQLTV